MLEIPNNSSFSCSIKSIKDQKRWLMTACLHPCWFCERNEDKDSLPQNHIQPNIPVTCQLKFSLITYSHFTNFQIFQRVLCEKSFFYIDFDLKIINLTVHPILLTCLNIIEGGHKRWDVVSCDPQYISVANCKPHHIDFIQYIIQITQYCPNHIQYFIIWGVSHAEDCLLYIHTLLYFLNMGFGMTEIRDTFLAHWSVALAEVLAAYP